MIPTARIAMVVFFLSCFLLSVFSNNYAHESRNDNQLTENMDTTALFIPKNNNPIMDKHFSVLLGVQAQVHRALNNSSNIQNNYIFYKF